MTSPLLIPGLTMDEYRADKDVPALSSGIAHLIASRSALHAWYAHPRLNPHYHREEAPEFDYGTAAHSLLLERDESGLVVVEADDWRKKDAKELRASAYAAGKTPLLMRQLSKLRAMVKAAQNAIEQSELAGIFTRGEPEVSIFWREGETRFRARPDWLTTDRTVVLDYKTTTNAEPDTFLRAAIANGYDIQEAFYRRAVKVACGKEPLFVFMAQEKEAPFACSLVAFDPAMQDMADRRLEYAISLWKNAMQKNEWPGYPRRIAYAMPPAWYAARNEQIDEMLEFGGQA